jgi:hypothetical protein
MFLLISIVAKGSVCMVHADSAGETYVSVAPPVCVANVLGEVFIVDVNISNVQNLRVFEFKLAYNNTLLDALGVVQGPFFPSPPGASIEILEINRTMGFVWVRISLSSSEPTVGGSGTLAAITFNVTSAPAPPEEACGVFDLYDILLYDGSMNLITYCSTDGMYFWGSIQVDPVLQGGSLELSTPQGEIVQGGFGGTFTIGEVVGLNVSLTYNGYPVGAKIVAFEVVNPSGTASLVGSAITNSEGLATLDFGIPSTPESLGTWTAFATAGVADATLWTFITFNVTYVEPVHSPVANFVEIPQTATVDRPVYFNASTSLPGFDGFDVCPITEYCWDFGDGYKANTTAPTIFHTYSYPGIYYVTLTVYAPGIPPYIDPSYNDTNTTYPPERKVVLPVIVGGYSCEPVEGYSQPLEGYAGASETVSYFAIVVMLTASFTVLRRTRKKISTSSFFDKRTLSS